jgi:hypothetical protein
MNREFIPYEQALELKELGFDEHCLAFYGGDGDSKIYYNSLRNGSGDYVPYKASERHKWFGAPLYQQAFRWFRDRHGLYADLFVDDDQTFGFCVSSFAEEGRCRLDKPIKRQFSTYEESELECIKFLIEIVERKPEAYN